MLNILKSVAHRGQFFSSYFAIASTLHDTVKQLSYLLYLNLFFHFVLLIFVCLGNALPLYVADTQIYTIEAELFL